MTKILRTRAASHLGPCVCSVRSPPHTSATHAQQPPQDDLNGWNLVSPRAPRAEPDHQVAWHQIVPVWDAHPHNASGLQRSWSGSFTIKWRDNAFEVCIANSNGSCLSDNDITELAPVLAQVHPATLPVYVSLLAAANIFAANTPHAHSCVLALHVHTTRVITVGTRPYILILYLLPGLIQHPSPG